MLVYIKFNMFPLIILTGVLKIFSPYLRKNILLVLEPHDYLFLNTFIIFSFALVYLIYKILFENHNIKKMVTRYKLLSVNQMICVLLIAIVTIISSLVVLNLDKYYNTPLINLMIIKLLSGGLLLLTGIFIFRESYNYKQIIGLVLAVISGVLLFSKY